MREDEAIARDANMMKVGEMMVVSWQKHSGGTT